MTDLLTASKIFRRNEPNILEILVFQNVEENDNFTLLVLVFQNVEETKILEISRPDERKISEKKLKVEKFSCRRELASQHCP